jgi:ribosome-associated protein
MSAIEMSAIRSQGPGGQNVNNVATSVQLRFDVHKANLPEPVKQRLLQLRDRRMTKDGVLVIKAQTARTQEANRQEALRRLQELVQEAAKVPRKRRPTRPSLSAEKYRLEQKKHRSQIKGMRGRLKYTHDFE